MNAVGIIAFALALTASIVFHEAGHFVTARHYGMKASKFFVGFGPTIWSVRKGETEYGIKGIPIGGFVKIEGMTSLDEVDPADADRAFTNRPAKARAVVMAAGSGAQFVLALVLIYVTLLAFGGTWQTSEKTVGGTSCVRTAPQGSAAAGAECGPGSPSPAAAAGVRKGDEIVSFDGVPVTDWSTFTQLVRDHGAGPAELVVERDGQQVTLRPELVETQRNRATGGPGTDTVGAIGMYLGQENVDYGPISAIPETFDFIGSGFVGMYEVMTEKIDNLGQIFGDNRDPEGFVSVVGAARIGGDVASLEDTSASQRVAAFILLVAGINIAVGIFNLLPLLPLDGGHLAVLGFEQGRHGVRRLFGYRGPVRRVDFAKLLPTTYATVAVLLGFSLLVLSADIVNPIRLE